MSRENTTICRGDLAEKKILGLRRVVAKPVLLLGVGTFDAVLNAGRDAGAGW